ncbi:RpiR family transcriptional regulator [Roseinatronobacter bogoriensis subsp. barguzinensis]|uniref:MurR/RpiR family transcriptional regulator n=1 Tax=Roseinatronobacter bogoriensis subsp. barguzinensis TaxID=441209 RepID=A0A2K8KHH9_9RHOB|nr:MurR/RpiR family transcriptional regulator [Rhodobaca barguzinensis]ATX67225.1 MurR/RpiR family transcriptional regulator [Rhodobaca barguzinensis]TDW41516.1 RpiR family transcriptional regulator [Rhodobaca barguzinensis]
MTNPPPNPSILAKSPLPDPPQTLVQLRELMLRISRGESDIALGPKARAALARILDLQGNPALLSITSLANALGVNPSTLTRLARNLGYSGFGAFQEVLLNASMAPPGAFYSQQAQKALASGERQATEAMMHLCRENQANIDRFLSMHDDAQFRSAVSFISNAPRVMIYGIRQFHAFATFLVYGLRLIRSDVHLLDSNALGLAEGIASLDKDDVLIVSSCAPYSRVRHRVHAFDQFGGQPSNGAAQMQGQAGAQQEACAGVIGPRNGREQGQ